MQKQDDPRSAMQAEMVEAFKKENYHGRVDVIMRSGKTKAIIDTRMSEIDQFESHLWVVDKIEARDKDVPREILQWGSQELLDKTDIVCWNSLHKVDRPYDRITLDEIQKITELSATYFDNYRNLPPIIGMTGTPTKDKTKKDIILYKLRLKQIFKYGREEGIKDGVIAPYDLNIVKVPLGDMPEIPFTNRFSKKTTQISESQKYNMLSRNIVKAETKRNWGWLRSLRFERQRFLHSMPSKVRVARRILKFHEDGRYLAFCPLKDTAKQVVEHTYLGGESDKFFKLFMKEQINHLGVVQKVSSSLTFHNMSGVILLGVDSDRNGSTSQKMFRAMVWREGYRAQVYLLVAEDTQEEEEWLPSFLSNNAVNGVRVRYMTPDNLI